MGTRQRGGLGGRNTLLKMRVIFREKVGGFTGA